MSTGARVSRWWRHLVDPYCDEGSRWLSSSVNAQTPDCIGDWFVSKLKEESNRVKYSKVIAGYSRKVLDSLDDYENETRLLVKLADTGRVIQVLERGIETTLHILGEFNAELEREWRERLMEERKKRAEVYEMLLTNDDEFTIEVGGDDQALELLTLMKYDIEKYGAVLTPREMDLISTVFDKIVGLSDMVVSTLPSWFSPILSDNAQRSRVFEGEEACLRQAAIWDQLHHPNIRKFYGACHVGSPFTIHENDQPGLSTWSFFHDCALGLEYVHRRGLAHKGLSDATFRYNQTKKRGVLSGLGLVSLQNGKGVPNPEKYDGCLGYSMNRLGESLHQKVSEDVEAFGLVIVLAITRERVTNELDLSEYNKGFPSTRPDFLNAREWDLLQGLCTANPAVRLSIGEAIPKIEELAKFQKKDNRQGQFYAEEKIPITSSSPVEDITTYVIQAGSMTIAEVLQEIDELCGEEDFVQLSRSVYDRLIDLYHQLVNASSSPLAVELVEKYAGLVWSFFTKLER